MLWDQKWAQKAHVALEKEGRFSCRNLPTEEEPVFELIVKKLTSTKFVISCDAIGDLEDGVNHRFKNKNILGIDAVMQPDKVFHMIFSSNHLLDARGLADLMSKMKVRNAQLYFVVPSDMLRDFFDAEYRRKKKPTLLE